MGGKGNAILVVEVDLLEEDIDEFNRWYREEHGPFKLALPGYLGLRRFRAQDGSARFLALYELETAAAADDPGPMSPEDLATMQRVMSTWKDWKRTVWVEVARPATLAEPAPSQRSSVTVALSDHEQIRQLLARFIQLRDDKRFDEWVRLFTEDGTFEYPGARLTGRDAIRDGVAILLRDDRGKHLGFNAVIQVDGDTASVISDVVKLRPAEPGSAAAFVVQTAGRYVDSLVRTQNGWQVASRRTELLGF